MNKAAMIKLCNPSEQDRKAKLATYLKSYYQKNRGRLTQNALKYYYKHRAKILRRNSIYYKLHKEKLNKQAAEYRRRNKDVIKKKNATHYKENKQRFAEYRIVNNAKIRSQMAQWRIANINHIKEYRLQHKNDARDYYLRNKDKILTHQSMRSLNMKLDVFDHYSNGTMQCDLCDERRLGALCLDHIEGNGNKLRRESKCRGGHKLCVILKRQGYPSGFRVLCANCNILTYLSKIRISLSKNPNTICARNYILRTKKVFMDKLNHACAICGATNIDILTSHHIENNGAVHRRQISNGAGGVKFYRAIIKSDDFSGLECRCFSCNDEEAWRSKFLTKQV